MRCRPLNRRVIAIAVAAIVLPAAAQRQDKPARDDNGRLPDVANPAPTMFKSSIRTRDPKAPKPVLGPGPDSVAIRAGGKVLDLKGNPIPGATVYLIGTHLRFKPRLEIKSSVAATAKTREDGFYSFHDAKLPTSPDTGSEGAGTPYVQFRIIATAKGFGVGWHSAESMYAVDPPHPGDIQGRLPLDSPVIADIWLRPEGDLKGRIVDESGKPVAGVKVDLHDINLLDEEGTETTFSFNPKDLPGDLGQAVSDGDGRFRLGSLPAKSCCSLGFKPQGANAIRWLYASTSAREKTAHPDPPPQKHNGRGKHEVYPADMVVTLPTTRKLEVRVVADDDGKPVPDIYLGVGPSMATGIGAGGLTDADGRATLNLPPGTYGSLYADPKSRDMRFTRTYRRPLIVADTPAAQPLEFKMTAGAEVRIEVVDAETGKGIPKIQFEIKRDGEAAWEPLLSSTFSGNEEATDDAGKFRALLEPVAGKTFRVRVLGSNLPAALDQPAAPPLPPDGLPYVVQEKESPPFRLEAAKPSSVRFTLRAKKGGK